MAFLKCPIWQTQTDFDKRTICGRRVCLFAYASKTLLSSCSGIWPLALLAGCDCWKMSQWTQYYLHQNQAEIIWLVFIPEPCEFQHPNDSQRDIKKDTRMYTEPFIRCMRVAWNIKEKNTQSTWHLLILTAGMKKKCNHVKVSLNQRDHKSLFDISYCKMSAWMQMMSSHCHGDGLGQCIFQKERYVFVD